MSKEERNAEIIRRYLAGERCTDIASDFGVTKQYVSMIANRAGHRRVAVYTIMSRGLKSKVTEAARQGYGVDSAAQIAQRFGCSRNVIIGHWFRLRRAGLLPSEGV